MYYLHFRVNGQTIRVWRDLEHVLDTKKVGDVIEVATNTTNGYRERYLIKDIVFHSYVFKKKLFDVECQDVSYIDESIIQKPVQYPELDKVAKTYQAMEIANMESVYLVVAIMEREEEKCTFEYYDPLTITAVRRNARLWIEKNKESLTHVKEVGIVPFKDGEFEWENIVIAKIRSVTRTVSDVTVGWREKNEE